MNLNESIYARTSTGWFRLTPQHIGGDADIAAHLASTAITNIPNAFKTTGGEPVHITRQGKQTYLSTGVKSLVLATHFTADGDCLVPSFRETSDSVLMSPSWTPPANMKMHMGISVGTNRSNYTFHEAFLLATLEQEAGTFRLPLPNLYKHGPICLGRTEFSATSLDSMVEQVLVQLQTARWNTDLLDNADECRRKALFSYSLNGAQNIVATATLDDVHRVANPVIEKFILN